MSSFCTTHKSSVSTGFTEQIMPILHYNGSLVTWTVVGLTTARFKPLIYSMYGFTLSYTANISLSYGNRSSLYSLGTDRTENTASNIPPIRQGYIKGQPTQQRFEIQ
jgi:hypothetical protein